MSEEKKATLLDVKKYFAETSSTKFAAEWKQLTDEEKQWFKDAVAEVTKE